MTKRYYVTLLGAVAVTAAVILAGCGDVGGPPTDYAAKLAGTWMTAELDRMIPLDPTAPMVLTEVKTTVSAIITADDKANTGSFTLTIADAVPGAMQPVSQISVIGTIKVDASQIEIAVTGIDPPEAATANPQVSELVAVPQTVNYELMGAELQISSPLLPILLPNTMILGQMITADAQLTLTKQAAES